VEAEFAKFWSDVIQEKFHQIWYDRPKVAVIGESTVSSSSKQIASVKRKVVESSKKPESNT